MPLTDPQRELLALLAASRGSDRYLAGGTALHHEKVGCVYYSPARDSFAAPSPGLSLRAQGLVVHFGRRDGILPLVAEVQGQ